MLKRADYAANRFKNAQIQLANRLGEANWQRSFRIKNWMQKEEQELLETSHGFNPMSKFDDSGIGTSIATIPKDTATVASHTSYLASVAEDSQGRL